MMKLIVVLASAAILFALGCGGAGMEPPQAATFVAVSINPATVTLPAGGSQAFSATVSGISNSGVTWSVQEGAAGGSITGAGVYTAPQVAGTYHVIAMSQADSSKSAVATVRVGAVASNFTAVGNLTVARAGHTATLLTNGKVLIAGGFGNGQAFASAELYDPSTGRFSPAGNMTTSRARHTAIMLADGKVLIAGGVSDAQGNTHLVSAEIYNPFTETFTATGNMISSGGVRSTLLPDGRVLVAEDGKAELYDPASGTFALAGAYARPTDYVDTATLVQNGRVLVSGCAAGCTVGATELFDPQTGTFSLTGPMRGWGNVNTATLLLTGSVLFVGNAENDGFPADAEVYDPAAGSFTFIGNTTAPHEFSAAARLPDGMVLIAGGQLPGGNGNAGADLYVPATGMFAAAANMTIGRHSHTATLLADGTVLIVGGYSSWPTPTSSAEIYKPPAMH